MYGYIAGLTDTDEINFCPYFGEEIAVMHAESQSWIQRKYREVLWMNFEPGNRQMTFEDFGGVYEKI